MECLNKDAYKKEKTHTSCTSSGRDDQFATSAKLLDIMYEPFGFNADLIETIY